MDGDNEKEIISSPFTLSILFFFFTFDYSIFLLSFCLKLQDYDRNIGGYLTTMLILIGYCNRFKYAIKER